MKIKLLVVVSIVAAFASCSKEEVLTYDPNDSALYFDYKLQVPNSMDHIFYRQNDDVLTDTVFIQINVMGAVVDYDRAINVEQLYGEGTTAEEGVNYVPFDNEELKKKMIVPANSNHAMLPVVLNYTAALETERFELKIGIVENEHFRPRLDEHTSYILNFSAMLSKPASWDIRWQGNFGDWGPMKMGIISDITGITDWSTGIANIPLSNFYQQKCRERLKKINAERPQDDPLKEPDGTVVSFNPKK